MNDNFSILVGKLDKFIKKYYLNEIIKGFLIAIASAGLLFMVFVFLEYFGYFDGTVRAVLFYGFILFNVLILARYIIKPIAGLLKIGKRIDFEQAAIILGKFFKSDVDDKILNTLQLKKFLDDHPQKNDLIIASIEQRSRHLHPVPFTNAVNLRENVRYVPISLFVLTILSLGFILYPVLFREPASRIMLYGQEFERPAPFQVRMVSETTAIKNQPYVLKMKVEGDVVPDRLDLIVGEDAFKMTPVSRYDFEYEFRTFKEPLNFKIRAANFLFGPFEIEMQSKAVIKNFTIVASYPSYTNLPTEKFDNIGDIRIPEGTNLEWNVFTEDATIMGLSIDNEMDTFNRERHNEFNKIITALNNFEYAVVAYNSDNMKGDSLNYFINVIPDVYPTINVEEFQDSVMLSHLYFRGLIIDDYGFSDLNLRYRLITNEESENSNTPFELKDLDFDERKLNQEFYYHIDLNEYEISPGSSFEYYFEVSDNDAINGAKTSQTRIFSYSIPDHNELIAETIASDEEVKSGLNENKNEVDQIQKEIDELRKSMLESENISWEQQETLKNLLEKQKQAQESYEKLKEFTRQKQQRDQQFRKQDEELFEKQQELEQLFEEVLTDEMKELYDKIQDELEKLDREEVFEMLDQMEFEMEDYENRLERALELFKQLQVERMLNESIENLERVKEELDDLNEDVKEEGLDDKKIDQQDNLNQEYEEISDLIDDMREKNEELSRPNDFEDTSDLQNEIGSDLNEALKNMQGGEAGESGKQQNNASDKMQELKNSLQAMQAAMQQQNLAEDIRTLREIMDNLIRSSVSQEKLMEDVRIVNIRDPKYVNLIQQQNKISSDLEMIKDSLTALAKRQIQIQSYVSREISLINLNITEAIDQLINRRKHTGISRQQFVMTHINNLALLLNESMENMQNQMQMQMSGEGGEPQKGTPSPGFQDLREMQQQMNQMLEELRQGHQQKPGESGEQGMSMSEKLARMAAEQEKIRNSLNDISNQLRGDGENTKELEQLMREMERTELDIVSDNITRLTQMRQQRILTRLLEHEKAEMEREKEERRVGETANFYDLSNPEDFFEYNREKNRNLEMLQSLPPGFRPHYKSLVELYFLNVQE